METADSGPVEFHPSELLFPFRSRWFDSRAGRVHYIDEGEGPVLFFLHGSPTWSFLYRGIIARMRRRFRCVAADYLGFGLSEHPPGFGYRARDHADVMRQLLHHLDLRQVTLMGHEWGGPIAMRLALDETPRVRALVMGNTWYWPPEAGPLPMPLRARSSQWVYRRMLRRSTFLRRFLRAGVKHRLDPSVYEHYAGVLPTPESRRGAARLPRELVRSSFWLGEIAHAAPRMLSDVPLLLTWGVHDPVFPPRLMKRFREDFRRVAEHRLDARHFIQEDAPGEISEAIEQFLAA